LSRSEDERLRADGAARRRPLSPALFLVVAGLILSVICGGCAPALHCFTPWSAPIRSEVTGFKSQGRWIRVDVYRPGFGGLHAAAIVAHGSSGVHDHIRNTATEYGRSLARHGVTAFVVHYFDATGTILAGRSAEEKNYFIWMRVLMDAERWVRSCPGVDPDRVGMLGHSLGAFLAVGAAASDPAFSRVVLFGGGLEPFLEDKISRMPPTLLCHGAQDKEVPLAEARFLLDFLATRQRDVRLVVYPGQGHTLTDGAACQAVTLAARFLSREPRLAHKP
jgi:dienelactone hydrolase